MVHSNVNSTNKSAHTKKQAGRRVDVCEDLRADRLMSKFMSLRPEEILVDRSGLMDMESLILFCLFKLGYVGISPLPLDKKDKIK